MNAGEMASPWWDSGRHGDRKAFLQARGAVVRSLRGWFEGEGFAEVETGILQVSPGNETHLHAPATTLTDGEGRKRTRYLRTSPEFACKKLLAAGEQKIVEFARVFRDRERGALHLPEFTMLEWYRAEAPYEEVIRDALAVIALAAKTTGIKMFSFRGKSADPHAEAERLTVAQAFAQFAQIDLLATITNGEGRRAALASAAGNLVRVSDDDTWSDIFSKVLVEYIEPHLGQGRVTVLHEYPAPEAALARVSSRDARVAERFEVYACGVELANGFGELTDASEQRKRFRAAMNEKERRYGERYPLDEDFLNAVAQMPAASGVALGLASMPWGSILGRDRAGLRELLDLVGPVALATLAWQLPFSFGTASIASGRESSP